MSTVSTILNVVMGATALLFIGLSLPLIRRRVGPNRLYGFRTSATLGDEALWYEVNAKTGWDLLWVGLGMAVLTALHLAGLLTDAAFTVMAVAWLLGGALWSVVHGMRIIRDARRRPPGDGSHP